MEKSDLYLISNASSNVFTKNTRTSFTNILPKTFTANQNLFLSLETIIFDNDFNSFISSSDADIIIAYEGEVYYFSLNKINNLSAIIRRSNEFFFIICNKHRRTKPIAKMTKTHFGILLEIEDGLFAVSKSFFNFFHLREAVEEREIDFSGISINMKILKFAVDRRKEYISHKRVKLNSEILKYINISVDCLEKYPSEDGMINYISCLPIESKQTTTYFSPMKSNFFKLNSSLLREIKIDFLQPNGKPVYFSYGSPNILKMSLLQDIKKKNFFYVQVSSKPTVAFPDNTCNLFEVELPKEYVLNGNWEVGVVNAYVPRPTHLITFDTTIYKIPEGSNYLFACFTNPIQRKKYAKFPLLEFTKRELCTFLIQEFSEFFHVYISDKENIYINIRKDLESANSYVQIVTSISLLEILNIDYVRILGATVTDVILKDRFKEEILKFKEDRMSDEYLSGASILKTTEKMYKTVKDVLFFFEARDFYDLHEVENEVLENYNIKRILSLSETEYYKKEEVRIIKILQNQQRNENHMEIIPTFFFIYSDFVKESIMGDRYINLLKMLPYKSGPNNLPGGIFDFSRSEFFPVSKQTIKNMRFFVKTHSGKEYSYFGDTEHIILTLKFQEI